MDIGSTLRSGECDRQPPGRSLLPTVGSHQAACATTIPLVHSTYWWEGKLVKEQETMILLKTTAEKFQALQETIKKTHSYKVPEIIALPVTAGLPQYLEWVREETH
ncbi:MAG: divalent-cation tolerance protein CutA [Nitrospira sp.]|nr:divalent-cation tolerance protein CutA [Nitrospira sp.]